MENLFLAQQVCKHWRLLSTISDSIQKALFMRPCSNAADAAMDAIQCTYMQSDGAKIQVAINPSLCKANTHYPSSNSSESKSFPFPRLPLPPFPPPLSPSPTQPSTPVTATGSTQTPCPSHPLHSPSHSPSSTTAMPKTASSLS